MSRNAAKNERNDHPTTFYQTPSNLSLIFSILGELQLHYQKLAIVALSILMPTTSINIIQHHLKTCPNQEHLLLTKIESALCKEQ